MNDRDIEDTRLPDEAEAVICEDCGQEMELNPRESYGSRWIEPKSFSCKNPFCPEKYSGTGKEMAIRILELLDDNRRMKHSIKHFEQS